MYIDERLQALFNEYYAKGKIAEFVSMMQALISMSGVNEKPKRISKAELRKRHDTALRYLEKLSPGEWIKTISSLFMPYDTWPDKLKKTFTYVVRNIETFDDKRMNCEVPKKQRQKYPFGMQFFKVLLDNDLILVDESGCYPRYNMITEFLNSYCKQWDLKETKNHRAQIVRFTNDDIKGYLISLITPKRSKFTAIAKAFDVSEIVLAGYENYISNTVGEPTNAA